MKAAAEEDEDRGFLLGLLGDFAKTPAATTTTTTAPTAAAKEEEHDDYRKRWTERWRAQMREHSPRTVKERRHLERKLERERDEETLARYKKKCAARRLAKKQAAAAAAKK